LFLYPNPRKKESSESDDESSDTVDGEKTEKNEKTEKLSTITNFASSGPSLAVVKPDDKSEGVKVSTTAAAIIRTTKMEDKSEKSDSAKTTRKVVSPQSKENTVVNKKQK